MAPERLVVGLVRGVHGLRGGVRVEVLSDDPLRFDPGSVVHPEGTTRTLTVAWRQEDGPGLLLRFDEVTTRAAAEELRDRYLEASITGSGLGEGEFYWHELEDVPVVTGDGEALGVVKDVFRAGGGEVLVVRGGKHGEVLVPTVHGIVRELAPREGRIVVDREALGLDEEVAPRRPRGRRTTRALKAAAQAPASSEQAPAAADRAHVAAERAPTAAERAPVAAEPAQDGEVEPKPDTA